MADSLRTTLATLREVIISQQQQLLPNGGQQEHEPTPTEYFAVVVSTLPGASRADRLREFLQVLIGVLPLASKVIVQTQFKNVAETLLGIIKTYLEDDPVVLQLGFAALGKLMLAQDTSEGFWSGVLALKSVNALLASMDSQQPSVRRVVQQNLTELLQLHKNHSSNYIRNYVKDFCTKVMQSCTRSSYQRSLQVVLFLEYAMISMREESILKLFAAAKALQSCEVPKLTAAVYRSFDSFFQNPTSYSLSSKCIEACAKLLIDRTPETHDMESNTYFVTAMASAVGCFLRSNRREAQSMAIKCVSLLEIVGVSEFAQVHTAVGSAIKRIMTSLVDKTMIEGSVPRAAGQLQVAKAVKSDEESQVLKKSIKGLRSFLQLKYQHVWIYTLDAVRSVVGLFRGYDSMVVLKPLVEAVADMYQAVELQAIQVDAETEVSLRETLGVIVKACGVLPFLSVVPLVPANVEEFSSSTARDWVVNILHSNLKLIPCSLAEFGMAIMSSASKFSKALKAVRSRSNANAGLVKLLRNKVVQMWSLFPDFCAFGPKDIPASFPKMVPVLEFCFADEEYPDIVPFIVVGLDHLVTAVKNKNIVITPGQVSKDMEVLQSFAQTFVPLLLKYVEVMAVGDTHFQSVVKCVSNWISISPAQLTAAVAKKLLALLLSSTSSSAVSGIENETVAAGWMSIMTSIIPHLNQTLVQLLYKTVRPLLAVDDSLTLQKRAYNVLNCLLLTHGDTVQTLCEDRLSILYVLTESLLTCHISSRNMRLKCLESLLNNMMPEQLRKSAEVVLGEVLICQKDANKKTRDSAIAILRILSQKLDSISFFGMLCSALIGETTQMRSSAVTALCLLLVENKCNSNLLDQAAKLFPTVVLLLQEESADQSRAVLSYVKVLISLSDANMLHELLPIIVPAITTGLGSQKSKFASRCRNIVRKLRQKVGEEQLRSIFPPADLPLLDYVARQARRAERKKVKSNRNAFDQMMGSDSEDDSDNDNDDGDDNEMEEDQQHPFVASSRPTDSKRKRSRSELTDDDADVYGVHKLAAQSLSATSDYRLGNRPKAVRVTETAKASHLPSSLNDLVEGGVNSRSLSGKLGSLSVKPDMADEPFQVTIAADGRVIVKESEVSVAALTAKADDSADAAVKAKAKDSEAQPRKRSRLLLKKPGEEYKSKKGAGGDVWKKGMMEPHAYIPLDPKLFSKKHRQEAVEHFGVVVNGSKKSRKEMKSAQQKMGLRRRR